MSGDAQEAFQKFKNGAAQAQHATRLHVFIADEAHWGIKGGSVHDKYVNDSTLMKQPNIVILLVTATPANLLTGSSRVPEVYLTSRDAQQQGKALVPSFIKGCEKQAEKEHKPAYSSLQMQTIPQRASGTNHAVAPVDIEHNSKARTAALIIWLSSP